MGPTFLGDGVLCIGRDSEFWEKNISKSSSLRNLWQSLVELTFEDGVPTK